MKSKLTIIGGLLYLLNCLPIKAQPNYPTNFSQSNITGTVSGPTAMAFLPDGRILVCEQTGALRIVKAGAFISTPVVSLSVNPSGERGLIGIAVDPNFSTNSYIYLYYTTSAAPIHNRISRFTMTGDLAGPEQILVDLDDLSGATNHNGGSLGFGADGKLYAAVGDNANSSYSQILTNRHGKILRYNSDGTIPSDNPQSFPGISGTTSGANRAIWSVGLRNPFTMAFQPGTGKLFVNDVGAGSWEEINDATLPGLNFGWPNTEGNFIQSNYPNFTLPVYAYTHSAGDGNGYAITGGTFYNPTTATYPSNYKGKYFYMDLSNSWINYLSFDNPVATGARQNAVYGVNEATRNSFATNISGSGVGISTGTDGNLYYLSRSANALVKINFTGALPVNLISFQLFQNDNSSIKLNWETSAEKNTAYFEIMKSENMNKWENIGKINAKGNPKESVDYEFIDNEPIVGLNYYRLKMVDIDGKYDFSPVKAIKYGKAEDELNIYPNPNIESITVQGVTALEGNLKIYSMAGQDLTNVISIINLTNNQKQLNISNLPKGKYILKTSKISRTFIKN